VVSFQPSWQWLLHRMQRGWKEFQTDENFPYVQWCRYHYIRNLRLQSHNRLIQGNLYWYGCNRMSVGIRRRLEAVSIYYSSLADENFCKAYFMWMFGLAKTVHIELHVKVLVQSWACFEFNVKIKKRLC